MKLARLVFTIWIFFWALFLIRGLYKGEFEKYSDLLKRDVEARRAYVVGEELYAFLKFSMTHFPQKITYQLRGKFEPIDKRRFIYYLYPHVESEDPEFILCYKVQQGFKPEGFYRFATLKKGRFILRKIEED